MSEVLLSEAAHSEPGPAPTPAVRVGVITTPALPGGAEERLERDLGALLSERYPDVMWDLERAREGLVEPPARLTELVDAARALLLARGWDLAVVVTEVPLRLSRRPLLSHASPTHGVALISLPALGVIGVGRRLREAAGDAIAALIGDAPSEATGGRRPGTRRRLVELANDVDDPGAGGIAFLPRVLGANLRLLMGMIRANHPWRLAARLANALVGAVAAGSFALVTADVWRIAGSLGALRLSVLTALALATAVVALIATHHLWERTSDPRVREQVVLFNTATLVTLGIGIGTLCGAVCIGALAVAALLVPDSLFGSELDRGVDAWDYVRLAWLTSILATVGGALGGALESHDAVREAAYAQRPDDDERR